MKISCLPPDVDIVHYHPLSSHPGLAPLMMSTGHNSSSFVSEADGDCGGIISPAGSSILRCRPETLALLPQNITLSRRRRRPPFSLRSVPSLNLPPNPRLPPSRSLSRLRPPPSPYSRRSRSPNCLQPQRRPRRRRAQSLGKRRLRALRNRRLRAGRRTGTRRSIGRCCASPESQRVGGAATRYR